MTPLQGQQRAVHKPLLHQAAELWGQDREIPPPVASPSSLPSQYLEYSCPKFSSAMESLGGALGAQVWSYLNHGQKAEFVG